MSSLLHDFGEFLHREFSRRPGALKKKTINTFVFIFFLLWCVATIVLTVTFSTVFGWGWVFLLIPGILGAVTLGRFVRFHADKYSFYGPFG